MRPLPYTRPHYRWFWLVFFTVLAITIGTIYKYNTIPVGQGTGLYRRCDFTFYNTPPPKGQTGPRSDRDQSWLCVEGVHGWPAVHSIAPMNVQVYTGDFKLSTLSGFVWEAYEIILQSFIDKLPLVDSSHEDQLESTAGSLIGDATITDMFGVLLGVSINELSGFSGFYSLYPYMRDAKVCAKYTVITIVGVAFSLMSGAHSPNVNYGLMLNALFQCVYILAIVPFLMDANDIAEEYRHQIDFIGSYRRAKFMWVGSILLIAISCLGWRFLSNEFYQAWATTLSLIICLRAFITYRNFTTK